MPTKVLDAYALMAFFEDEPGAKEIEKLFKKAAAGEVTLLITTVNLGEVWYSIARAHSTQIADHYIEVVNSLPVEIVTADWELTRTAAQFKAEGRISYADCFAAALAKGRKAELVTGDTEFKSLEEEISIAWL